VLLRHAAVAEAAVVPYKDEDGKTMPRAHVVLREGFEASQELAVELQEHSKRGLDPAFYKYPRRIVFVERLEKTASGKIQRRKLRDNEQGS